jgi:uncharacterized protein (TIGR02145 family)
MVVMVIKIRLYFLFSFVIFFFTSCGGDSSTLFDVNNPPKITSVDFEIRESLKDIGQITSSDDESDAITYKLVGGDDKDKFDVTTNGYITFNFTTDYHAPDDTNKDNNYNINVEANDGLNKSYQDITIKVLENPLPKVTTTSFSIFETFTQIGTLIVTDEENESVTVSIAGDGSDDSSRFVLNENNISFHATFITDFHAPSDVNGDNNYTLRLKLDDGVNIVYQDINVSVTEVTHHGVVYDVLLSDQDTQKRWLDRNLGASRACNSFDDAQCYGYYFQWGRGHDGHQESNSTREVRNNINLLSIDENSSNFVDNNQNPKDWTDANTTIRRTSWLKTDGSSICPKGFRIASKSEFENELSGASNNSDLFNSFLKIPTAGYRLAHKTINDNDPESKGTVGYMWFNDETSQHYLFFRSDLVTYTRTLLEFASGYSVRCIKD